MSGLRPDGSSPLPPPDASSEDDAQSPASYERLQAIFQLAPIGIGIVDLEGRTVLTNNALRDMLGYTEDEFAAVHFEQLTHPDDVERNLGLFTEMVAGRSERFEMYKRFFHKDGRIIWGHLTVSLLRDEAEEPALAIGMLENVTEKRELEAQLRDAETTYRLLVEQVPAVVYVAAVESGAPWTYVSPQIESLLGFTADEWLADPGLWSRQMSAEDRDASIASFSSRASKDAKDVATIHYRMRRSDGREIWVRDESTIERGRAGERVFRGVLVDVTREKQLEAKLERQAFHDSLTLLANRELFRQRVQYRVERGSSGQDQAGAVLFVDLDDFKTINDSLGHAAGDDLICSVAGRISGCIRPTDTAGRLGGDEFAVLLDDLGRPEDAISVAERIQTALQRPHRLKGRSVVTSASIGVAYLADADSTDAVLRNADLAMYHAKSLGKGRVATYEPAMHRAVLRRLDIRSALEGALERDELTLHLQPIVSLDSAQMVSAEALLRWHHPAFGAVSPEDFIPIAEETGAITRIGTWVLSRACQWLAVQRRTSRLPLSVSVNVSPVQLQDRSFVAAVREALVTTGLGASSLVLEVTERALMSEHSWARLRELKELGVGIAIDDFGTGYSSLAYLSELSVDLLKIDRSFIAGLTANERSQAVPRAVIHLAESLGLGVVAEGIETRDQWMRLRQMGCSSGQGYLFSPPVPMTEISGLAGPPLSERLVAVAGTA